MFPCLKKVYRQACENSHNQFYLIYLIYSVHFICLIHLNLNFFAKSLDTTVAFRLKIRCSGLRGLTMDYVYQQLSILLTKLPVPLEIISNHFVPSTNTVNPLLTNRVGSTFLHLFVIPENSLQSTEAYLELGRTCTMKLFFRK